MRTKRRSLDPVATKAAILQAAAGEFAAKGFSATSIQVVADKAGVPKGLVLYHFESKEELWKQILLSKIAPLFDQAATFLANPEAKAEDLVRTRFRLLQGDPELVRILAWMSLEQFPGDAEKMEFVRRVGEKLRANKDKSDLPSDVDAGELTLLQLAAMDGFFRFRFLYTQVLGLAPDGKELEDRFLELLQRISMKPLQRGGQENG
jgi:AcrR family transcriptional regulator